VEANLIEARQYFSVDGEADLIAAGQYFSVDGEADLVTADRGFGWQLQPTLQS